MSRYVIRVCSFSSLDDRLLKRGTYEQIKDVVVKIGRFSAWDAGERPHVFGRLCRDPELEIDSKTTAFPWTKVTLKEQPRKDESE